MKQYGRLIKGCIGSVAPTEEGNNEHWREFYDDLSGERLNSEMVEEARKDEMKDINKHKLYNTVNIENANTRNYVMV